MSIAHLVLDASPVVQLVMLMLLLASLLSWTVIFQKWSMIKRARSAADQFERRFWSGTDLTELYKRVSTHRDKTDGMAIIFEAGFKEFARVRAKAGMDPRAMVEGAHRAMRVALSREIDALELHLSFLATVGSTSPYIGLFGTVWGIMNSFIALGNVQQATIASVAPGIAEALIATAMGLFAAIPAVIAYNRYSNNVERLVNHYDAFVEEFSALLQRQVHA
jgi:biopolymer transport protein TolQ